MEWFYFLVIILIGLLISRMVSDISPKIPHLTYRGVLATLLLATLSSTTLLSAASNTCPGDVISVGDTNGELKYSFWGGASNNEKDYYKYTAPGAGTATISFRSTSSPRRKMKFFIGSACSKQKDIYAKYGSKQGSKEIVFDASQTVYILAKRKNNDTDYTIHIDFTPEASIPIADDQSVTTDEDVAKAITLSGSDPDGGSLTYTVTNNPTDGTLSGTAPNLTYTPNTGYFGSDSFKFRVNNGTNDSAKATVSITINEVTAPVADDQSVDTYTDTLTDITLTGTDDQEYIIVTTPTHGTLSGTAPDVKYISESGYTGTDSFTFKVNNGTEDSNIATVSINVQAIPLPIADEQSVVTTEDTDLGIILSGSDSKDRALTYSIVTHPPHGTLSGTLPNNLTYTPDTGYSGDDSFTFKVNNGSDDSISAVVSIRVDSAVQEVVENADDICYEEPVSSGMMCMDMGMCSGGLGCKNTYQVKNIGDSDLSDVVLVYDETGMGMSFGSDCGVDPDGTCKSTSDIDFGPMGFFGKATEFNLTNDIPPEDDSNSVWAKNFMSMSCFSGEQMYATYVKDGKKYRGKMKLCREKYQCAEPKEFTPIYRTVTSGDIKLIGNTSICKPKDNDSSNKTCIDPGTQANNYIYSIWRDGDTIATTDSSSSARLDLPDGAVVLWAGLYWQGHIDANKGSKTLLERQIESETMKIGFSSDNVDKAIGYTDIAADRINHIYDNKDQWYYQGFKDVTDYVKANGAGWYWGADVSTTIGRAFGGAHGAWTIAIAYQHDDSTVKNLSIYDGYMAYYTNNTNAKKYAKANKCDEDNTGIEKQSIIPLSGFLTPESGKVNSTLLFFSGEGDIKYSGDKLYLANKSGTFKQVINSTNPANNIANSTITKNGTSVGTDDLYPYHGINTIGIDIDTFDVSSIMENGQYTTAVKMNSAGDRYFPGIFGLSTELYVPSLCYDYAYEQNGRYLTEDNNGTEYPSISASLYSTDPVNTSIFIRNREASDIKVKDMKVHVYPIDTDEGKYIYNTTRTTPPGETLSKLAKKPPLKEEIDSIQDILIGDVGAEEYFYIYYGIQPKKQSIDMPINLYLEFNTTITIPDGGGTLESPYYLKIHKDIPMCADGNFSYNPIYGIFNVEHKDSTKYNINTQIARRVDKFEVTAYDATNIHTPISVNTAVAVEVIDVGAYHEVEVSCQEPDSALTPRIWLNFDGDSRVDLDIKEAIKEGMVSDQILHETEQINEEEDIFDDIRRNVAFRVTYVGTGDGDLLQTEPVGCSSGGGTCYNVKNFPDLVKTDLGNGKGKCSQDMGSPNTIASHCGNAGTAAASAMTALELSECMECIYGYDIHYFCSRDNFAIRPKAFKVSLADDNGTTPNADFANNIDSAGSASAPINLVAGYPYRFDINATSDTDENPVKGYVQKFDSNDSIKKASMSWKPESITATDAAANCNEPEDQVMNFYLVNGTNSNPNPLNVWDDNHDTMKNIGEYEFSVIDEEWTKYDWDEDLIRHHTGSHYTDKSNPDCIVNNSSTPASLGDKAGCRTSSDNQPDGIYKTLKIEAYPYKFNMTSLSVGAGPDNDPSGDVYLYINTLDETQNYPNGYKNTGDENMSYNVQGTFAAYDYTGGQTANFVDKCYAKGVNLSLVHTYLSDIPNDPDGPNSNENLTYNIIEHNTTNVQNITRAREHAVTTEAHTKDKKSSLVVVHTPANFEKSMRGAITMKLNVNFDREYNNPLNPRLINFSDVNVSLTSQPGILFVDGISGHKVFGNRADMDQNITFAYARAKPEKTFYDGITDSSIVTPVSVVVYCDLNLTECQNRGLQLTDLVTGKLSAQTSESFWWKDINLDNVSTKNGALEIVSAPIHALNKTSVTIENNTGEDQSITVSRAATATLPLIVPVTLAMDPTKTNYVDRWLIYNQSANTPPALFYNVRFVGGSSSWTGHGKTGHIVEDDVNSKKTRRLEW